MHAGDTLSLTGFTTTATSSATWIWVILDGTTFFFDPNQGGQPSGGPFNVSFPLAHVVTTTGLHDFSVFAVDSLGSVSQEHKFWINVIAPTPAATETATASAPPPPTASPGATRPPAPTLPANIPVLDMHVECGVQDNFEVLGADGLFTVPLGWTDGGWFTRLRVNGGDLSDTAYGCNPTEIDGVVLSTSFTNISRSATLVSFTLQNTGDVSVAVDVVLNTYLLVNWVLDVVVASIDSGLVVYSRDFAFTLVCRGTPLVSNVSTFWFGANDLAEGNLWSQTLDNVTVNDGTGVAFSWQNISVAAHNANATRTVIMRWGPPVANRLFLWIAEIPENATRFELFIKVRSDVINETVSLWAVLNSSVALIRKVADGLPVNTEVGVVLDTLALGIVGLVSTWDFVAVDSVGTLSTRETNTPKDTDSQSKATIIGVSVAAAIVVVVAVIVVVAVCRRRKRKAPNQGGEEWAKLDQKPEI
jgi:hypothetical protein